VTPLVDVRRLVKRYEHRAWRGPARVTEAVASVSFTIDAGEMFGLVGESGSGKTTTARCLLRLVEPTSGEVRFKGEDVLAFDKQQLRRWRREAQMVFQDPQGSLNPRMRIGAILREPLEIHGIGSSDERRIRVEELLGLVGLDADAAAKYPEAFSGGQRQRIGIARALALSPSLLVADEPVSALDVSVQAQVVNLLLDVGERLRLACLFVSHDLRLVRRICTRVAVMYRGRIVEIGPVARVFGAPAHPYTGALVSAVPSLDPDAPTVLVGYDARSFDGARPLVAIADDHWAAV
jgi:ABC-type oligopeptide transport system ATPase subunit